LANEQVHVHIPLDPIARFDRSIFIEDYIVSPMAPGPRRVCKVGGYAIVTLETDPNTGAKIALKRFKGVVARLTLNREVQNLIMLQHPCVVRILGWTPGHGSNGAQIRMEWAEHGTIEDILARPHACPEAWTPTQVGIVICDLVLGMRYVHSVGIIHGDLKPSNILLNGRWRGLISDFGVSRFQSSADTLTRNDGTVWYSAPELCAENCGCTTKTDGFAVGLVLYEILTWRAVFPVALSNLEVCEKLKSWEPPPPPVEFGSLVFDLIARCWSRNPDSRPSFNDILGEFRQQNYEILPGANASEIRAAVGEVVDWERNQKQRPV
jgi:serine/threonine-protein kinase